MDGMVDRQYSPAFSSVIMLTLLNGQNWLHFLSLVKRTDSTDSPDCLPILLNISVFFFFSFSVFHFLVVGSVQQIKLTRVNFAVHVKVASGIVSHCFATANVTILSPNSTP